MTLREIRFRARRSDNGEWVYGDLVVNRPTNSFRIWQDFANVKHGNFTESGLHECSGSLFNVIPETIGQCTGLPGKSGEYIYEGDILKTFWQHDGATNYDYELMGKVIWNAEKLQFSLEVYKGEDTWIYPLCSFEREEYFNEESEVIGNIHEHLYLLI